jgi:hypothetical protein
VEEQVQVNNQQIVQQPVQQFAPVYDQQPVQQFSPIYEQPQVQPEPVTQTQFAPIYSEQAKVQMEEQVQVNNQQPVQQFAPVYDQQSQVQTGEQVQVNNPQVIQQQPQVIQQQPQVIQQQPQVIQQQPQVIQQQFSPIYEQLPVTQTPEVNALMLSNKILTKNSRFDNVEMFEAGLLSTDSKMKLENLNSLLILGGISYEDYFKIKNEIFIKEIKTF